MEAVSKITRRQITRVPPAETVPTYFSDYLSTLERKCIYVAPEISYPPSLGSWDHLTFPPFPFLLAAYILIYIYIY